MTDPRFVAVQRIRARLTAGVPAGVSVTPDRKNYFFDEDTAAVADVAVHRGDTFLLVIIAGYGSPHWGLLLRIWHRYCDEVWLVDLGARAVTVAARDQPRTTITTGVLTSAALPGLELPVEELFL
jgi:hypothetical protein